MEDKILNNRFNAVDYGMESLKNTPISINPVVAGMYEESTTSDIEELRHKKHLEEDMYELYLASDFYKKYGNECKRVERPDVPLIYHYFKGKLKEKGNYDLVEIFCMIAEFFDLNYKVLFMDVISLDDRAKIMSILEERNGLDEELQTSGELF